MKLSLSSIKDTEAWKGYHLPSYDPAVISENTKAKPQWLHFGSGNIFRIFPAALCQRLIEKGRMDTGIVCCEGYDDEIITRCFRPYDNLTVGVTLNADGSIDKEVIGSMAESLTMLHDSDKVAEVFRQPSLQMVSFTITEKGYSLRNAKHELHARRRCRHGKRPQGLQELHGAADRDVPRAFPRLRYAARAGFDG